MLRKITFILLSFISFNCLVAQESGIKIFNKKNGKETLIKENKRIRIKKSDGVKISGKYTIVDSETILIKNEQIKLNQIEKIKRNPILLSYLINGVLIYSGSVMAVATVVIYAFSGNASSFLLLIPAAGLIYGGFKSPNILKGYTMTNNWEFEIITTLE